MFARLFASGGLSLDRLRALLEVSAAGSIAKAAGGDAVKQSQFSRQIKELEDFFAVKLIERHGRGVRLTANGKELARIGRFFLLGLSNFQRGCLADEQTFRIGASATVIRHLVMPVIASARVLALKVRFSVETVADDEIETRLHELTLDFGIVSATAVSRPLKIQPLGAWRLDLWVPRDLARSDSEARRAFAEKQLPLVIASGEMDPLALEQWEDLEPIIHCADFLQAAAALRSSKVATVLPDFMRDEVEARTLRCVRAFGPEHRYSLAWNPRTLRLNPAAARVLELLGRNISQELSHRRGGA